LILKWWWKMNLSIKTNDVVPSSEFSSTFVQAMYDRMAVSFFKYGKVKDAYPYPVNALESAFVRLLKYCGKDTFAKAFEAAMDKLERNDALTKDGDGNTEWLVDASNCIMIEFMKPRHPNAHFEATSSKESPGRATDNRPFLTPKHTKDLT
jgi:hypothetical protein